MGGENTKPLRAYEGAPELSLAELEEIKIPIELFEIFSFDFCRKYQILPLRFDEEQKIFTLVFVDSSVEEAIRLTPDVTNDKNTFLYRISQETFDYLIAEVDPDISKSKSVSVKQAPTPDSESPSWTIAIIESNDSLYSSMEDLFTSQAYSVLRFTNEAEFRNQLRDLSQRIQEDEDLLNLAENQRLIPFQAIIVRRKELETPKTFCDFVWAHFSHLRVSVLEDRWLGSVIEQSQFQNNKEMDDFAFHLRHGDYYHAAIESLKKGNIYQAVELLEQVSSDQTNYIKAKVLLGKAFLKKKNYDKALKHFQKAYDHWCEDPEGIVNENVLKLLYLLAYTFEKSGRLDDSLKLYERVAAEDPLYREVSQRMAQVKSKRKKAIKAGEKKLGLSAFSSQEKTSKRYEKLEEIGKGGMGIVYRAKDSVLGREVALKILNSHFKDDKKIVETFLREAKSLASLNHLNIVTIFDAGIEDGNYYISMEFIDGRTVRELLKRKGHFRISTSLALCKQVLKALAYAHSKHVIHRDITTNNMMLTETKVVKLMDFGLARVVNQLHSEQSIIGGTPYFMSPEQVEGAPIDHRTDIYSFGVCLFEMLTGQVPFPMENPGYHHLHTLPPNPQSLKPGLAENLCALILKCLEKKPEDRFQSADEILDEFRKLSPETSGKRRNQ